MSDKASIGLPVDSHGRGKPEYGPHRTRSGVRQSDICVLPANNVVPQGWMTQRTEGLEYDSIAAVPNYFYGQVLVRAVIVHQWWWRVYPMRSELAMGRTRVWM